MRLQYFVGCLFWITGLHWSYLVTMGYTGLHWVTLSYTGLHWVTLGYTELHWVTLVTLVTHTEEAAISLAHLGFNLRDRRSRGTTRRR